MILRKIGSFLSDPAVARIIGAVFESGVEDCAVVSTDDREIALIAARAGGEVPDLRPAALSDDCTTTLAVVHHAIGT